MQYESTFNAIDNILRNEAGCSTELDYIEQTSWLLFLKYLDDRERWANPVTRKQLLDLLEQSDFPEEKLNLVRRFLNKEYHSISDARQLLGMDPKQIRNFFLDFQHELYNGPAVNAATA